MTRSNTQPHPPVRTATLADRTVARVGFGAMQLAERGQLSAPSRDTALTVLRQAVELGINHVDTAEFYGDGVANELILSALHPYPDNLVLVSKVGAEHDREKGLVAAQRPKQLRAAVEANLRSLGVEQVAVVNLRRADAPPGIIASGDQHVDLDSQLAEMVALRDEGKIGGIGLSNVSVDQLRKALPVGIACVQNPYNLLDRSGEPLLDVCREHDVAWVPFFPLGSAFPGMPKVTAHPAVIATATALDLTPAQVGLAWLLAHDSHILLIPGTASPTHLLENVAAGNVHLDAETMSALDASALPPH
ncbi:MAG: aldo/keto reductase [Sciscionella sp.]